jgi:hypothetical protein
VLTAGRAEQAAGGGAGRRGHIASAQLCIHVDSIYWGFIDVSECLLSRSVVARHRASCHGGTFNMGKHFCHKKHILRS